MKFLLPLLLLAGFVLNSTTMGGQTVSEQLRGKSGQEKAQIKSSAIGQIDHSGVFVDNNYGLIIEIVGAVEQIEVDGQAGVQLFARAWKNGKRVGFLDGTVEIERFRIFNPPILVNDPVGSITREYVGKDGVVKVRRLREDPKEAIRQSLAHIINVTHTNGDKVISGKRGNTTSTFYPDASGGATTMSATYLKNSAGTTWADARGAASSASCSETRNADSLIQSQDQTSRFDNLRFGTTNDTSPIPDGDVVSSVTWSIYKSDATPVDDGSNTTVNIVPFTPASDSSCANSDYATVEFTDLGSKSLSTYGSTAEYKDFTLNATGIAEINKTGVTRLMWITGNDLNNVAPNTTGTNPKSHYSADNVGTANDPKLVVVHAAPVATFSPHQMFPF